MLRNADCGRINDLVRDLVSCTFKQVLNDVDDGAQGGVGGLMGVLALAGEEAFDVFANDPLGLDDAGDAGEFVDELITSII